MTHGSGGGGPSLSLQAEERKDDRETFKMRKMKNEGKKTWTTRERKSKRGGRKIEC